MSDYLQTKVRDARVEVNTLTAALAAAKARLEAYEDALLNSAPQADPEAVAPVRGGAQIKGKWARVLARLMERQTFTIEDAMNAAAETGFVVTPTNVRSQLSSYAKHGLITRVSNGLYKANIVALLALGITKPGAGPSAESKVGG